MTDEISAVPASSVSSGALKAGWITKCGGGIKNWRKRWLILNGDTLYYYPKENAKEQKGSIRLQANDTVGLIEELDMDPADLKKAQKKSKFCFGIKKADGKRRLYIMFGNNLEESKSWTEAILKAKPSVGSKPTTTDTGKDSVEDDKEESSEEAVVKETSTPAETSETTTKKPAELKPSKAGKMTVREKIATGKKAIPFLCKEKSQPSEFWEIWLKNIPKVEELTTPGQTISFQVSTSINMEKITWRTKGPQSVFIQKMVDFFYIVGAPETEIDRLNAVGEDIRPEDIGSWIDMSAKGGIDGGWYFPVEITLPLALKAAEDGAHLTAIREWAAEHHVLKCQSVGRDMGAEPPRQTELCIELPEGDFASQLEIALSAVKSFGFEEFPAPALAILSKTKRAGLSLSINVSSEDEFVRIGILVPKPSTETVLALCEYMKVKHDDLGELEGSLCVDGPSWVEFQHLKDGFGYNVYKEGFDVVFHYHVGSESKTAL